MKPHTIDPRTCPDWQVDLMYELYRLEMAANKAQLAGDLTGAMNATAARMDILCKLRRCLAD